MSDDQGTDHQRTNDQGADDGTPSAAAAPMPAPTVAPPIMPGSMTYTRRASWPVVIGVLLIVVSSMGILGSLIGMASLWMNQFTFGFAGQAQGGASMQSMSQVAATYAWPVTGVSAIELLVNVLGLVAGIGLMKRTPRSIGRVILWAWLKLVASTVRAGVTALYTIANTNAMMSDPQMANTPGMATGFSTMMIGITVGMMLVMLVFWNWSLPIVALLWLRRERSQQEIALWSQQRSAPVPPPAPAAPPAAPGAAGASRSFGEAS